MSATVHCTTNYITAKKLFLYCLADRPLPLGEVGLLASRRLRFSETTMSRAIVRQSRQSVKPDRNTPLVSSADRVSKLRRSEVDHEIFPRYRGLEAHELATGIVLLQPMLRFGVDRIENV